MIFWVTCLPAVPYSFCPSCPRTSIHVLAVWNVSPSLSPTMSSPNLLTAKMSMPSTFLWGSCPWFSWQDPLHLSLCYVPCYNIQLKGCHICMTRIFPLPKYWLDLCQLDTSNFILEEGTSTERMLSPGWPVASLWYIFLTDGGWVVWVESFSSLWVVY